MTRKDYQYFANIVGAFHYYLETNLIYNSYNKYSNQVILDKFTIFKKEISDYFENDNNKFDWNKFDAAISTSFCNTAEANTYANTHKEEK